MRSTRGVRGLAALAVAGVVSASAAQAAPSAAPAACTVLTRAIAASLIKEQPKTILATPLVCNYGRTSERAATMRTTLTFSIIPNPTVAAAQSAFRRIEKIVPAKVPSGMTAFKREKFGIPGGDVLYVYFRQPHGSFTGGYAFIRIGPYLAQLTPEVYSDRPSFTASDLKTAATRMGASWPTA